MILALNLLCEDPNRRTGLTSLFHEFIERSLTSDADLQWVLYLRDSFDWPGRHERLRIIRDMPLASVGTLGRIFADQWMVGPNAARRGAAALVTVGFSPVRTGGLPVAMHMLSLQHLDASNKIGAGRRLFRKWAAARGLVKAALVITNTHFAVRQILAHAPGIERKLLQSYEGLQHEQFYPGVSEHEVERLRTAYGLGPGYLFWCSNFYPYKQAEHLIEAYSALPASLRKEMPLLMVGGGKWGGGLEAAQAKVREKGIEEDVKFVGWVPDADLGMLYRLARVFVLASREETFGRCVLEAMACGIPCLVNNIPVMEEVTQGAVVIVDFQNREAAAEGLHRIATATALREGLQTSGLARAQDFSFDKLTRERMAAIRQMVEQHARSNGH